MRTLNRRLVTRVLTMPDAWTAPPQTQTQEAA
jgi:hypothetical protein